MTLSATDVRLCHNFVAFFAEGGNLYLPLETCEQ